MKRKTIRSVTIGARGTGMGSDNLTFTVGSPFPDALQLKDRNFADPPEIVGEIIGGHENGQPFVIVKRTDGVPVFDAIGQPYTVEYERSKPEPENNP